MYILQEFKTNKTKEKDFYEYYLQDMELELSVGMQQLLHLDCWTAQCADQALHNPELLSTHIHWKEADPIAHMGKQLCSLFLVCHTSEGIAAPCKDCRYSANYNNLTQKSFATC